MNPIESIISSIRNSQILRLCLLGILTMVMLIPITMIGDLVSERKNRSNEAIAEVSSKWGQTQFINGPALVFQRRRGFAVVAGGVTALYGYLFVLLTYEDGALLVGSISLFLILALIMYVTRHIDWHGKPEPISAGDHPA